MHPGLSRGGGSAVISGAMHVLKSSLLLLASLAIVGCPSSKVEPDPEPDPTPVEPEPEVRGPCDTDADALRDGSRVIRWAPSTSEDVQLSPDAEGRWGAVVLFEAGQDRTRVLRDRGFKVLRELPLVNGAVVRATDAELEALAREPHVAHVQKDYLFRSGTIRRSPVPASAFLAQAEDPAPLAPSEITPGLRTVQAPDVWDPTESGVVDPDAPAGQGIKVCVLDSGVDRAHAEVMGFYGVGYDFVDNDDDPNDASPLRRNSSEIVTGGGHGTHVAGTIGARYGHGGHTFDWMHEGGVVGVAPRAEILVGRVLGTDGNGGLGGIVAGINWCIDQGSHIINMSLGSDVEDVSQRTAVSNAVAQGALLIAAAGNDGLETPRVLNYPAAFPGVMAVASVDADNKHSGFSQIGNHISVAAPGEDVLSSTIRQSGYYTRFYSGDDEPAHRIVSGSGSGEYEGNVVDCGLATSYESCSAAATCGGFVALVRRGENTFGEKAEFARGQGAKMVVIYDPDPTAEDVPGSFTLGDGVNFDIPVFAVSRSLGEQLLANEGATVKAGVYMTDYAEFTGTSMATPHVSGVAAVVWSAQPDLTAAQVRQVIECSAIYLGVGDPPASGKSRSTGHGLVQTQGALELLASWNANGWPAADTCE